MKGSRSILYWQPSNEQGAQTEKDYELQQTFKRKVKDGKNEERRCRSCTEKLLKRIQNWFCLYGQSELF
jgi:hypothetical protein